MEDFVRYFLNSIAHFSPLPSLSIADLNLIRPAATVHHRDPSLSAVPLLRTVANQTSVAVIDDFGCLVDDICTSAFSCFDESAAAAVVSLTAGELASYIDCYSRNSSLISLIRSRLHEKNLEGMLKLLEEGSSPPSSSTSSSSSASGSSGLSSSSGEESTSEHRQRRLSTRRTSGSFDHAEGAMACNPRSSLMAVMLQAVAHRTSFVWVVDGGQEHKVVGVVVLDEVLRALRDHLYEGEVQIDLNKVVSC